MIGKYSLLTPEEKEEYNYKFKDYIQERKRNMNSGYTIFGYLLLISWIMLGVSVVVLKEIGYVFDPVRLSGVFATLCVATFIITVFTLCMYLVQCIESEKKQKEMDDWMGSKFKEEVINKKEDKKK